MTTNNANSMGLFQSLKLPANRLKSCHNNISPYDNLEASVYPRGYSEAFNFP